MSGAPAIRLHGLLERSGIAFDRGLAPDAAVCAVVQDSRAAVPGAVFVAVRGTHEDGNAYAAEAARRGAAVVITDAATGPDAGVPVLRVPDARRAYALLCRGLWGEAGSRMALLGVTGTNGKTTSAYLVRAMDGGDAPMGLIGTIRYEFEGGSVPARHTTPDAGDLHRTLAAMLGAGCRSVVMEVSSHSLEQERLAGLEFDAALFTNLTRDHLDYHGTMERYFEAKSRLFGMLKAGGTAVINNDDPFAARLTGRGGRFVRYGIEKPAELSAREIRSDLGGSRFDVVWEGRKIPFETPLIGRHNVYNVLGAAGLALARGNPPERCAEAAAAFSGVSGRLERIDGGQDFDLFVDYAHTDDGLKNVLAALRPFAKRELLVLFGCGGDRDRGKRPKMAHAAQTYADFIVLTSDNPRHEDPNTILKEIAAGFSPAFRAYETHEDRRRAIRRILLKARKGDIVLLAGKGHEDAQVIGNERVPFSDRSEALRVVAGL